ncbi:hypothetical protein [Silvanigrella aquatica]|uniref:PI3K/PI4K catalytic domain-containing protein n=1 Tax=Silvanigrella aquatica TaxID=1915309 RepID=A0A1L4CY03_9BACT|nr:hypothetical protein [Silvanigrella aquatica]APJ02843.1 hypothetical protein AXG55_02470 [Silvanigrella aquatica]
MKNEFLIKLFYFFILVHTNSFAFNIVNIEKLSEIYSGNIDEQAKKIEEIEKKLKKAKGILISNFDHDGRIQRYKDSQSGVIYIERKFSNSSNLTVLGVDDNPWKEYFAYKFSKEIGLNIVPPTFIFRDAENKDVFYMRQLYIQNARNLKKLRVKIQDIKVQSPLNIFDKLVGSKTRMGNHLLLFPDGSVCTVGHEYLFSESINIFDDNNEIKSFFYDINIYKKMKATNWDRWLEINFPKISNYEKMKKIFLENLKKLIFKVDIIIGENGESVFFDSAQKIHSSNLSENKKIFDADKIVIKDPNQCCDSIEKLYDRLKKENSVTRSSIEKFLSQMTGSFLTEMGNANLIYHHKDDNSQIEYLEKKFFSNDRYENLEKARREYFAYQLDRELGLNIVPPTVYIQESTNKDNYIVKQFFITNTISPEGKNADKRYHLNGTPIPLFDKLLGARDRHFNNYLISSDGNVVAIDHEHLFSEDHPRFQNEMEIKAFFYDKKIYDRFLEINWEEWANKNFPYEFDYVEKVRSFLENMQKLKLRMKNLIEKYGEEEFFKSADKIRQSSMTMKKSLFISERNIASQASSPKKEKNYPKIRLPLADYCLSK